MKKFLVVFVATIMACSAFAAGENVATSKAFVDTAVAQKQDKIPANDGTAAVLTNTGTAGNVGTKDVYTSSAAYSDQTDSLIDAATMNAGVQNAIDTEFECISYNANGDCLLVRLAGVTELPSGYTELKYLQGTGEQYIDTGLYFDFSSSYNIFGKATNIDLQNRNVILGSYSDQVSDYSNSISFEFGGGTQYSANSGHFRVWASSMDESAWSANVIPTDVEVFYNMVYNPDSKVLDTNIKYNNNHQNLRVVVGRDGLTRSGLTMRSLRFFRDHRHYYSPIAHPIKIGEHRIYKNNVAVGAFIPARRDSDGALGMYDTVTNTFLTNSGDGEFIAGPAVNQYMPSNN